MSRCRDRLFLAVVLLGCFGLTWGAPPPGLWDGGGADNKWSTGLNWGDDTPPSHDGTVAIAMGGSVQLFPFVDSAWSIDSLTFSATAGAFTLTGSTLSVDRPGIINNSVNSQTINAPIDLRGPQSWNASAGPMIFGSGINTLGRNLQITGGFNTTFRSVLSGGGTLTKNGNGTLVLGNGSGDTSPNTYTGLTTINAGGITLDKAAGTVAMPGDLLANGGTVTANRAGQFSSASNVTLSGGTILFGDSNTIGSFTANFGGYNATSGLLNLTSTAQYALTTGAGLGLAHFNLTGASGGGINLPSGGSASTTIGNVGLGGVNRTINGADGSAANDLAIGGVISGSGGIVKSGLGTLSLSGANTYSGGTVFNAGAIAISSNTALGNGSGGLTFDGGTLRNTLSTSSLQINRAISIGAGGAVFESTSNYLHLQGPISGSGPISHRTGFMQFNADSGDNAYNGTITVSGDGFLVMAGPNRVTLGDINVIDAGSLWLYDTTAANSNVVFNSSGQLFSTIGIGATVKSLTLLSNGTGGNPRFAVESFQIGSGVSTQVRLRFVGSGSDPAITALHNGSASASIDETIDLGGATREIRVGDFVPGAYLTISGVISNGGIIKSRRGDLELTGANTYSGGTNIVEGTVRVWADNALGSAGSSLRVLGINGGVLRTSSTFTLTHPVDGYPEINVDGGTTLTLAANVSGQALTKRGAGTLVVNSSGIGDSNFVNDGTLALATDQSLGYPPDPTTGIPGARLWMIGGAVRAEGGARNFANGVVVGSGAAFAFDGNLDMTFNGPVTLNGAGSRITVNNTTTFNGAVGPAGAGHDFVKDGPGTLVLNGNNTIDSAITVDAGTLQLAGGVLNSPITNNDRFRYSAGALNGRLSNYGTIIFDSAVLNAVNGIANYSTIDVPFGKTLNVGGAGLNNQGLISGSGTIGGSGAVINLADIVPNGVLTLAGSGVISNMGQIEATTGNTLRLNGAALANTGTIRMGGGTLGGTAQLNNQSGGTITGRGIISAQLGDSTGLIAVSDGTLNIVNAFTNYGVVQLAGIGANLAGGTISNHGTIQGFGSIASPIVNLDGSVEAMGGTLILGSYSGGNLALVGASVGNKVLFTNGLAVQAGIMSLAGGTIDNNGHVMSNTGQISGYGVFRSGGLTNNGAITLAGGTSTVNGSVVNAAGKKIEVRFAPAVFTGAFTNNGIFKSTGASVTFTGIYSENGQFISDPAENFFEDVVIGTAGAWSGGAGDRFSVSGNLINASAAGDLWETSKAELRFIGGSLHQYLTPGTDLGTGSFAGYDNNFSWGSLVLGAGDSLVLQGNAIYVGILDLTGGLAAISSISGDTNIYYDLREPANAYLRGQSYPLSGGGMIAAVPEPATAAILFLATAIVLRRRRSGAMLTYS